MKKSGERPKCGGTRINAPFTTPEGIYIKFLRIAQREYYICRDCGYVETYLTEKERYTLEKHGRLMSKGTKVCTTCGATLLPCERACDRCGSVIK
ncbi:MAG: hypothetical protein ACW99U_06140 [Candidatus Thorarchaeota archaeon]|jgi:predicted nucleic-acid-binding Zn-ribbon protein